MYRLLSSTALALALSSSMGVRLRLRPGLIGVKPASAGRGAVDTIAVRSIVTVQGAAVSEIKIVRSHAGERAEQAVTTGTKAWELFKDDTDVIAARVGGTLK